MNLARMLATLDNDDDTPPAPPPSIEGQIENLDDFLKPQGLKVGDYVRLNHWGKRRYRFPKDGILMRITAVWDHLVLDESGQPVNGEVCSYNVGGKTMAINCVDLRYYRLDEKRDGTD